ncbi:MAG: hypothetical protein ACM3PD_09870, partial [Chloroflexota bacterium]
MQLHARQNAGRNARCCRDKNDDHEGAYDISLAIEIVRRRDLRLRIWARRFSIFVGIRLGRSFCGLPPDVFRVFFRLRLQDFLADEKL